MTRNLHRISFAFAALLIAGPALAQSAPPVRIRGTIDAVKGSELDVTSRAGEKFVVMLGDKTNVTLILPAQITDIKDGSFIGTAAMPGPNGTLVAHEVQIFPEAMRGTGEGHRPYDLAPESTMTNATVADVVGTADRTLTLKYKDGEKKLLVPKDAPIITYGKGDTSMLKAGGQVIVTATKGADGKITADRIALGKDGLVPPM
jgi:hypothetical protein